MPTHAHANAEYYRIKKTHLNTSYTYCVDYIYVYIHIYIYLNVPLYNRDLEKIKMLKTSRVRLKFWTRVKTRFISQGNNMSVKIKSKIVFGVTFLYSYVPRSFNIKVYICRRKIKTTKRQGNSIINK